MQGYGVMHFKVTISIVRVIKFRSRIIVIGKVAGTIVVDRLGLTFGRSIFWKGEGPELLAAARWAHVCITAGFPLLAGCAALRLARRAAAN